MAARDCVFGAAQCALDDGWDVRRIDAGDGVFGYHFASPRHPDGANALRETMKVLTLRKATGEPLFSGPVTKAEDATRTESDLAVLFSALESCRMYIADAPQEVRDAHATLVRFIEDMFHEEGALPAAGPAELPKSSRLAPLLRDLQKVAANPGGPGTAQDVFRRAAAAVPDPLRDHQPGVPRTFEDAVTQAYVNRHRGASGTPHPNLARRVSTQAPREAVRKPAGSSFSNLVTHAAAQARGGIVR